MLPILFRLQVGGHTVAVGSYSTFMVLAWIAMVAVGTTLAARRGLSWRRALGVFGGALLAGVLGARVFDFVVTGRFWHLTLNYLLSPDFQAFALYGGFVFGALAAIAIARLLRLPVWRLADCAVPSLAIGIALMRTGCFLRGCCFGVPTKLPWGVTFPTGSPAWSQQLLSGKTGILGMAGGALPVHPTELYELGAALLLAAAVLLWRRHANPPDGAAFLVFAIAFTLFRIGNDFLRASEPGEVTIAWLTPAVYVAVIAFALVMLGVRFAENRRHARALKLEAAAISTAGVSAIGTVRTLPLLPWETDRDESGTLTQR